MLQEALRYLNLGYSIIPVDRHKKPLISWKEFQERKASEDEVKQWYVRYPDANIGIVTGAISKLTVFDQDSEEVRQEFLSTLPEDFQSPEAKTPNGYHTFCCFDPTIKNKVGIIPGLDIRSEGGYVVAPPSKNGKGGYKWLKDPGQVGVRFLPEPTRKFIMKKASQVSLEEGRKPVDRSLTFKKGERDKALFHYATMLKKGGATEQEMIRCLYMLADQCDPPFPKAQAQAKAISAIKRANDAVRSMSDEVEYWISLQSGKFTVNQISKDLSIHGRKATKNLYEVLRRLCKRGVLEKDERVAGTYRIITNDIEYMDFTNIDATPYNIVWPFKIHDLVDIYPKNIIVVAGETNAGKTSFMLQTARLNMHTHSVKWIDSESGPGELYKKIMEFNLPISEWNFLHKIPRDVTTNYCDQIEPDGLNFVDYLQANDDFCRIIGNEIDQIHKKLDEGIAIIGVQKKRGMLYGRGADFSAQKSRLYITLSRNVQNEFTMELAKVKNYKGDEDPQHKKLKYRMLDKTTPHIIRRWYKTQ